MEFSHNEYTFLSEFFGSIDNNKDGMLSRKDIEESIGLENEEQVEDLFKRLKGNATSNPDGITFEEF